MNNNCKHLIIILIVNAFMVNQALPVQAARVVVNANTTAARAPINPVPVPACVAEADGSQSCYSQPQSLANENGSTGNASGPYANIVEAKKDEFVKEIFPSQGSAMALTMSEGSPLPLEEFQTSPYWLQFQLPKNSSTSPVVPIAPMILNENESNSASSVNFTGGTATRHSDVTSVEESVVSGLGSCLDLSETLCSLLQDLGADMDSLFKFSQGLMIPYKERLGRTYAVCFPEGNASDAAALVQNEILAENPDSNFRESYARAAFAGTQAAWIPDDAYVSGGIPSNMTSDTYLINPTTATLPAPYTNLPYAWAVQHLRVPLSNWPPVPTVGVSKPVVVMLDTGVYFDHEDLYKQIEINNLEIDAGKMAAMQLYFGSSNPIDAAQLNDYYVNVINTTSGPINLSGAIDWAARPSNPSLPTPDRDNNGLPGDVAGWDFVNHDNDPSDDNGHGTMMAGVLAASGNNVVGIVGVDSNAKIIPYKVFDSSASLIPSPEVDQALLQHFPTANNIVAVLFGGNPPIDPALGASINSLLDANTKITFVVPAGNAPYNFGTTAGTIAEQPRILVAGSAAPDNSKEPYSNTGVGVDVLVPGGSYAMTTNMPTISSPSLYDDSHQGTSLSAAALTGIVTRINYMAALRILQQGISSSAWSGTHARVFASTLGTDFSLIPPSVANNEINGTYAYGISDYLTAQEAVDRFLDSWQTSSVAGKDIALFKYDPTFRAVCPNPSISGPCIHVDWKVHFLLPNVVPTTPGATGINWKRTIQYPPGVCGGASANLYGIIPECTAPGQTGCVYVQHRLQVANATTDIPTSSLPCGATPPYPNVTLELNTANPVPPNHFVEVNHLNDRKVGITH